MKKSLLVGIMIASLLVVSACNVNKTENDIIASTSAGDITKDELYDEMKDSIGIKVLENLILKKSIETEFTIEESELEDELKKQKASYGDDFPLYLEQNDMTEEIFKKQIEFSMLQSKLVDSLDDSTEEEIKAEYDKMAKEIHAQHILVEDKETAEEVIDKLEKGGDFAELAKEYSTEKKAETSGGDLGWFGVGQMVKPFEEAVYNLPENEISEPVKSNSGYHVIEVLETREVELDKSFEELKPIIEETLKKILFEEKLKELVKEANVDIKVDDFDSALDGFINSTEK